MRPEELRTMPSDIQLPMSKCGAGVGLGSQMAKSLPTLPQDREGKMLPSGKLKTAFQRPQFGRNHSIHEGTELEGESWGSPGEHITESRFHPRGDRCC